MITVKGIRHKPLEVILKKIKTETQISDNLTALNVLVTVLNDGAVSDMIIDIIRLAFKDTSHTEIQ